MSTQNQDIYIEEDEIDLRELWQTILNGKKIIAVVTSVIVSLTLIYALSTPNSYKSETILMPLTEDSGVSLGGLGGLAAMAGVSLGGGGSMTPDVAFTTLLNDYDFMKNFIIKNKIVEHYDNPIADENYVFALGFRGLYDIFHSPIEIDETYDYDKRIFETIESLKKKFSISSDKKTALINVSFSDEDRYYAPEIIEMFLRDASKYLVSNNLRIIDNKLKYFSKEMNNADGFELRQSLSAMISKILQDKVMMKSKIYYQCDVLTEPSIAYIKDKSKPKRGLILVVSFITSIILGIFLVFFLEFIKGTKEEEPTV